MSDTSDWMVTGSDLHNYLQACREINMSTFKQDNRLTKIFEHSTKRQGREYLKIILNQHPEWLKFDFTNDAIGNPTTHDFGLVRASASTLQYIGVLSNLVKRFGPLNGLRIVEIGGGYGGQCRTILDMFQPACYHLIDLPEVVGLQRMYLGAHPCKAGEVEFLTEPNGRGYDLVISNYALSEVRDNDRYMTEVVERSKHGYLTCNTNLVQLNFKHDRFPDLVSEAVNNFILVW